MRFIKVLIKVIIGLIIVAAIAGYLFIRNFDLNKYKSEISTLAEEQLGRKLAINGEAKLGISFTPTLIIEDVELANAEGASPNADGYRQEPGSEAGFAAFVETPGGY